MSTIERLRGLSTVRVDKTELLTKITENRDKHRAVFERAIEGWKVAVVRMLEEMVADAKAGRDFRLNVGLIRPEDHTDDYDDIIAMLTMSEDDELELTLQEFRNYVLDEWGWKQQWTNTTAFYTAENEEIKKP